MFNFLILQEFYFSFGILNVGLAISAPGIPEVEAESNSSRPAPEPLATGKTGAITGAITGALDGILNAGIPPGNLNAGMLLAPILMVIGAGAEVD